MGTVRRSVLSVLLLVGACGDGGTQPPPDAGPDATPFDITDLNGVCAPNTRTGEVLVGHQTTPGVSEGTFTANLKSGVEPYAGTTLHMEEGPCQIRQRILPFCDPACNLATEVCNLESVCIPAIINLPAGTMTVTGLREAVVLEPIPVENYYQANGLPNPPFDVGAHIRLSTTGDQIEPFELRAIGIAPMVISTEFPVMDWGQPLVIEWEPGGLDGVTISLNVIVDQHALGAKYSLLCEVEDIGSYTIPATLVDEFHNGGLSGFPSVKLERRTADHVEIAPGCIELRVNSVGDQELTVVGYTPCNAATPCPPPLMCNLITESCE